MGNCVSRDKDDYLQYDHRYVYCEKCLTKIKYEQIYVMAHCFNKTHIFCCNDCYLAFIGDKNIT